MNAQTFDSVPLKPRDIKAALGDYLALRAGVRLADADPFAFAMARTQLGRASLAEIAFSLSGEAPDMVNLSRAMNSSDFTDAAGKAMTAAAGVAYDTAGAEIEPLLWPIESKAREQVEIPVMDLGELEELPRSGGPGKITLASIDSAVASGAAPFSARFVVSRELILSDRAGLMYRAAAQLGGDSARIKLRQAASELDGAGADISSTTATGLDIAAVGEALGTLRSRATPQRDHANLRGEYLLIPPGREAAALALNWSMNNRLKIVVDPWLGNDS